MASNETCGRLKYATTNNADMSLVSKSINAGVKSGRSPYASLPRINSQATGDECSKDLSSIHVALVSAMSTVAQRSPYIVGVGRVVVACYHRFRTSVP